MMTQTVTRGSIQRAAETCMQGTLDRPGATGPEPATRGVTRRAIRDAQGRRMPRALTHGAQRHRGRTCHEHDVQSGR